MKAATKQTNGVSDQAMEGQAITRKFRRLSRTWKKETRFVSNVTTKAMHVAYQKIIGMGKAVVPLILADLRDNGPNDWFWALHVLTDANPIKERMAGDMQAMTEAWLGWGRREGYLDG